MRVAFLGLGRMGAAMAGHLLDGGAAAGRELVVWNRTPGKAGALLAAGAREAASPADAARKADVVVLMLRGPDDSREVLLGTAGVAAGAAAGTLVINATTIGPTAARELAAAAAARGLRYIDAPVAGSVAPAREGTLGVFVGASEADFRAAEPLLRLWGDPAKIRHTGEAGTGSAMKVVVNLALGITMAGLGEALRLAGDLDIARTSALDVLSAGPFGWTIGQKRPMLESGAYVPTGFSLMAKDLRLCLQAATHDLPTTAAALAQAEAAIAAGHAEDDYAALAGYVASDGAADTP